MGGGGIISIPYLPIYSLYAYSQPNHSQLGINHKQEEPIYWEQSEQERN